MTDFVTPNENGVSMDIETGIETPNSGLNLSIDVADLESEFLEMETERESSGSVEIEVDQTPLVSDKKKEEMFQKSVKGMITAAYAKIGNDQLRARNLSPLNADELTELVEATFDVFITVPGFEKLVEIPPWALATMGLLYSIQRIVVGKIQERDNLSKAAAQ